MRFLVTAGSTREKIDAVRDWGNVFTGNTGWAIARALAALGDVDLLTSNREHLALAAAGDRGGSVVEGSGGRVLASGFTSHAELKGALSALVTRRRYDAVFMTAAVADYRPVRAYAVESREPAGEAGEGGAERWVVRDVQAGKVKSSHGAVAFLGEPTEKLIDLFRGEWGYRGVLVKFKLEVGVGEEELIRAGQASRRHSGADYLVANTLDMVEGEGAGAFLLSEDGHEWVSRARLPGRLAELVRQGGTRGIG